MQIQIADPINQTIIFGAIFLVALFVYLHRERNPGAFPLSVTYELKGLAILAIIFCHIGLFLSADTRFLYPFSIISGIGVNLFLFLSGYGLAMSACAKKQTLLECYKHRLIRLFIPLWIVIGSLFVLDYVFLHRAYPLTTMIQSFAGFFPEADIFQSLNSPLWYFTLILFYYLVFPLLFEKRHPLVSAGLILLASYFVLSLNLPVNWDVLRMYQRHLWSFPLGIFFAGLMLKKSFWQRFFPTPTEKFLQNLTRLKTFSRWVLIAFFCFVAGYFAINSGIGESLNKEQTVSIIAMAAIVGIFLLKRFQFRLFYWFGLFSYEIYLLHWPIVYRYDLIYKFLPAGIATIIYLALFLFLGWGLRKVDDYLVKKIV